MRRTLFVFAARSARRVAGRASATRGRASGAGSRRDVEKAGLHQRRRAVARAARPPRSSPRLPTGARLRRPSCAPEMPAASRARSRTAKENRGAGDAVAPRVLTTLSAGGRSCARATMDAGRRRVLVGPRCARGWERICRRCRGRRRRGARRALAPRLRSGHRGGHQVVARIDAAAGALGARGSRRSRSTSMGRPGGCCPTTRSRWEAVEPWGALLPSLDPTTMGWSERSWYLGPHKAQVFDTSGNAGATAWWDGRIVGGWSQAENGEVVLQLLEDVGADAVTALEAEAERLTAWLDGTRIQARFPSPPLEYCQAAGAWMMVPRTRDTCVALITCSGRPRVCSSSRRPVPPRRLSRDGCSSASRRACRRTARSDPLRGGGAHLAAVQRDPRRPAGGRPAPLRPEDGAAAQAATECRGRRVRGA